MGEKKERKKRARNLPAAKVKKKKQKALSPLDI